jgi:5,10-methylenetetrahydrofolate reductase
LAESERARAAQHDKNEHVHFRAMNKYERAAEVHDAMAELFPHED